MAETKPGALAEDARAQGFGGFRFFGGKKEKEKGRGAKAEILDSFNSPNPPPISFFDYKQAKGGTLGS